MAITVKKFEQIISAHHDQPARYPAGDCLYFRVGKSRAGLKNSVSFLMRWETDEREHWHGIGPASVYTLTEAREIVRRKRQDIRDGIDPIAAAKEARARRARPMADGGPTFRQAAEKRFNMLESKWTSKKNRDQYLASLRQHAYPVLESMLVRDVTTAHVVQVLQPIWLRRRQTADRVKSRIEDIMAWAMAAGHHLGPNPAGRDANLAMLLPNRPKKGEQSHHPALPFAEAPEFMRQLREREGVNARCLEFLILTAARAGEVIGARWSEVDFETATWTVPKERMKMRREHRVPLCARAVAILRSLSREDGDYLFIGSRFGRPLGKMVLPHLLAAMGQGEATTHGFRSTFRDWAGETTKHANDVVEYALAHRVGGTEGAYKRGDLLEKRRVLMADWARYCESEPRGAAVVPMRRGAARGP